MSNVQPWWWTEPVAEVAAAILPLFTSETHVSEGSALMAVASWFTTGRYKKPWGVVTDGKRWFEHPDLRVAAEAMQILERAGLLMRITPGSESPTFLGLTRLGMHALQTNTVRQHLGLRDTADDLGRVHDALNHD
jgi:hypothetical protein